MDLNFPGGTELGSSHSSGKQGPALAGTKPLVRQALLRDPWEEMSGFS